MYVWTFFGNNSSEFFELCNNSHTRIESIHSIKFGIGASHHAMLIHNDNKRHVVAHRHLKVIGIVCCRDLDCAGSKVRINKFVSNDWNHSVNERKHYLCANHVLVARVIRMNCNGAIAHHCLGASCRNNNALFAITVSNRDKLASIILMLNFDI